MYYYVLLMMSCAIIKSDINKFRAKKYIEFYILLKQLYVIISMKLIKQIIHKCKIIGN